MPLPWTCPICRWSGDPERYVLREMLFGTRERYGYARCGDCGVLAIDAIPADLGRHYPPAYYEPGTPEPEPATRSPIERRAVRAATDRRLFGGSRVAARALRRFVPADHRISPGIADMARRAGLRSVHDTILDVGCGRRASWLVSLREIGFDRLLGLEPFLDRDLVDRGVPIRRGDIESTDGTYRLIAMHHAFEHVPDPRATLRALAARLAPDGRLLLRTPVMGTWFWRTYGADWWELDPPRHLVVHTRRSLELLAAEAGLRVLDVAFDSTPVEVIASEQIRRDLAWREPGSWFRGPTVPPDDAQLAEWHAVVARLNEAGDAGRAAFYLGRA